MLKKIGKIGMALMLVIGLLPVMSLRAYAAIPSFTEKADFVIEPPLANTTNKSVTDAEGLPNGNTAVILSTFNYVGNSYVYTHFLKVYDNTGALITDINLSSLMDTYYKMTDVSMLALSDGNLLITYNKSDSSSNNLQLGTVIESTPNTYFMVINESGQKVTSQTQINTFSAASNPALTRFVTIAELSDGNIAFSWQRNDNVSTVTRVFSATGTPVSSETLLVNYNASMSYVSAGDGVYMVAYNSGASADNIYLKLFTNSGALLKTIDLGARTGEKQLFLSTLGNGNFMFSQYDWRTGNSEVSLYDNEGTSQGGFTVSGYLGETSAAVYRNGAMPGFVTISTDPTSNAAINDAYNIGTEWSGTQYAYLNYYDYDGYLVSAPNQPVDSAPVVFEGYNEATWMFDVEYYPKFSVYPAFGDKVVFIKTDNTDASHYRINGKLFDTGPAQGNHVFTVTNTNDSGAGSLRWALEQAGAVSGGQVDFDPSLAGQTITLQSNLTGWNDQDWKGTTIGDASTGGFKLTGIQDATGQPAITINGNGYRGILATGSGIFEMSDVRLTGFDITDSSGMYDAFGSALAVGGNYYSSIQLNNIVFDANTMTYKQTGSIASLAALAAPYEVDLDRIVFKDNVLTATSTTEVIQGAALYYNGYMDGVISNSLFANNSSNSNSTNDAYGSAIGVMLDPHLKIWNNTFYNNHANNTGTGASYGPAMYAVSSSPGSSSLDIYNNVLIGNKQEAAPAGTLEELFYNYNNDTLVESGNNVISGDPFVDAAGGNFLLKGSAVSAINQGDNTKTAGALDLAGVARIYGGTVDIGAYEYVPGPAVPVALQSVVADGVSGTTTSTKIDLTFDTAIAGLTADDITITDGTGSALKGTLSGAGTHWSIALTSVTQEGTVSVAVIAPNGYTISGSPMEATVSLFTASPEATPSAVIDYAAEQLMDLTPNGSYTVNGMLSVTATAGGKLAIESSWLGTSLSIVKKGNASTTIDSAVQTLSLPVRPEAPTSVTATDETAISANNGTLTNVTTAMEYKNGATGAWTNVAGTTVTGLIPDTYYVRTKATSMAFASEAQSVTVVAFVPTTEATPVAEIDYAAEQLMDLTPNGSYTINGTLAVTATADGKLAIDSSWLGTSLSILKKGNGSTTIDSAAQTVNIPNRPAAPTGVAATDETAISANNGTLTNVTIAMEYKKGATGAWTNVLTTSVTELIPDTYYVRTKATSMAFASEAQSVTVVAFVPTTEATPVAEIDYVAEQLTDLTANGEYTINGTQTVTATADGKLAIDSSWLGTSLSIVKKGNASTTIDSAVQTLSLPVRPEAPTSVTATDETAISANNGTLTNVTIAMEYKKGATGAWTNVLTTSVTELIPDTYYVRTKATSMAFASEAQSVTVVAFVPTSEATPVAEIDYVAEQLTDLTANGEYTINGTQTVTATADGKLAIDSSWLGTSLSIVKKGNASTTIDSAVQTVNIPSRPAAPTSVTATDETAISANNGTLTNVTTAMEYKKGATGAWTNVAGTTVTGLVPDTYYVRTKATSMAFASEAQSVTVVAFVPTSEATPVAEIDYVAEQLTDLTANGAYTINGTQTVTATADGKLSIENSWLGTSLSIVKKGNASTTIDSAVQTLSLPVRPEAPTSVTATDETAISANNGTLTNVTTAMEYKIGATGAWTNVAGTTVTGLIPDTYYVRTKATSMAFASEAQSVTVVAFVPTSEATPVAEIDYVAEQLTDLTANGAYTINGTQTVTATADGKLSIESSWIGTSLSIVKKGNASTTIDSAVQTISLPARPVAPTDVAATDETALNANDGTLTNVTTEMEYRKGTAGAWTDVAGTTVTGLIPDTYYVRTKATAAAFTSASVQLTVLSFTATPEATPAADIEYAAEQLTGLTPNASYTVNGIPITAAADGNLAIDKSWLGSLLSIVKKGNTSTTTDSAAQTLSLPARPAAPVGVSVTDVTYNGANDGILQNLTVQMEYKIGSTGLWSEVTDTIITGLAPDTYYVREKATATAFASNIAQVTVHDSDAVIPAAPEVAADDQNNTIVGLDTSMEFSVDDDGTFVRYDGTNLPDLSGEHTVKVRVAASGSVPAGPATTLTFTTNELIPAGGLTVSASDPSGTGNNGYTQISVTPEPAPGHKLLYKNFGTGSVVAPNAGEILTGYTLIGINGLIPAANGDRIGIAEVDADGKVVKYGSTTAAVVAEVVAPEPDPVSPGSGSNPNSGTPTGNTAGNVTDVIVLVNGKEENAGKATTTTSGNLRTTTIAVDPARLQAKLDAEGNGAVVTIPMMLDSNIIVGELDGQMIKNMENVSATLVLQTTKGTYTLPASEINIGALAERLGNGIKLEDITLKITIGGTPASMNQVVTAAAGRGSFTLVAPSLDFTVTATYGTSTVEVSRFNAYVERTVALPDGIDPNRITTGIVVDLDGTVRHVPTRLVQKDGKYYAEINSLTNSTYSVVWHPLTFADVDNHWAKNAVNDMGSRLVINGVNETTFNPNADITRAEFAAIIIRGLGLKLGEGTSAFADVAADSWYAAAVETASGYGLITGFEDGTFRPEARITREQAMSIIAKAMKLTGLADQTGTVDTASVLAAFTDAGSIGAWAGDSLALAAKAGLITGRGDSKLEAKANVTRAEVAVLIQRLLQKSDLID
ncbi:S-layer homology domain-containing protein [Paenibacillus sp. FSL R7-0297]|uniref:S-layer homology domain-containing protein n=1 Tax=Paenibacillus sp. FSL R7-0297 TaxID=2921680 RepID=UPI0030F5405C